MRLMHAFAAYLPWICCLGGSLFGFGVRPALSRLLLDLLRLADALDARFCRGSSLDLLSRRGCLFFFLFFFFSSSVSSEEVEAGEGAEERVV